MTAMQQQKLNINIIKDSLKQDRNTFLNILFKFLTITRRTTGARGSKFELLQNIF